MRTRSRWLAIAACAWAMHSHAQGTVPITINNLGDGQAYVAANGPGGGVCRLPCTMEVATGSTVTFEIRPDINSTHDNWMLPCVDQRACTLTNVTSARTLHAIVNQGRRNGLAMEPERTSIALPSTAVGTVGTAVTFRLRNDNAATVNVSQVHVDPPFELTQSCTGAALPTGQSCEIGVRLNHVTNPAEGPGLKTGPLMIFTDAPIDPVVFIDVTGSIQGDLITHFYQQILGREPDANGKAYWEAEAARVQAMGASANFVWQALAVQLFGSAEYANRNLPARDTLEHMFRTFLDRASDPSGVSYYMALADAAMPFEGWIPAFAFSTEFAQLTDRVVGPSPTARPEVELVMDLYRGTLRRLPDSDGFNYWLGQFRQAQCTSDAAVRDTADRMTQFFLNSPEYQQYYELPSYVVHLYDAFMRRMPEQDGWNYWYGSLATNPDAAALENARRFFTGSPEFTARVQAVMSAGCQP